MDSRNLWALVGTQCITQALTMLDREAVPTAATVETARKLVDIAIAIEMLNLHWAQQSRYGAAGHSGRAFQQP